MIRDSVLELIGKTPMLRLKKICKDLKAEIIAKLELFNPGGSVKDRIALSMIEDAERKGLLKKGMTIVEATSGNTGVALAIVSAIKGYKLIIVMPENVSREKIKMIRVYGGEVVLTPAKKGMKGAVDKALEIVRNREDCIMLDQFRNPSNPEIHRKTTAIEILADTNGEIDYFVAGFGTGGTLTGVGEILKKFKPEVKIVAVEPENSAVLSGGSPGPHNIQGIGPGFIPDILNTKIIDEVIKVSEKDAIESLIRLAREEGIFVGPSSGAALHGALKIAERCENYEKIVVIFPDTGLKYLSLLDL